MFLLYIWILSEKKNTKKLTPVGGTGHNLNNHAFVNDFSLKIWNNLCMQDGEIGKDEELYTKKSTA